MFYSTVLAPSSTGLLPLPSDCGAPAKQVKAQSAHNEKMQKTVRRGGGQSAAPPDGGVPEGGGGSPATDLAGLSTALTALVPALHSLTTSSPRHALAAATPGEDELTQWRSDQEQQRQSRELQPLIAAAIQKELQPLLAMVGVPPSNLTPQPSPTTSTARAAAFTNSKLAASDSARRVRSI